MKCSLSFLQSSVMPVCLLILRWAFGSLSLNSSLPPPHCSHWGPVHQGWTHARLAFTCRPPGDLKETWQSRQYPLWQYAGSSVTSDLSHSTLQQGRPLREQQEVAAAVIQRCYKKYKQVGAEVFLIWSHLMSACVYMFQCN